VLKTHIHDNRFGYHGMRGVPATTKAEPFKEAIPIRFAEGYTRRSDETKRQSELEDQIHTGEELVSKEIN
jgi:hypothetical protein